jgi:hypothetical protein
MIKYDLLVYLGLVPVRAARDCRVTGKRDAGAEPRAA